MGREIQKLSARRVATIREDGRYSDGGNLYFVVDGTSRRWSFLYRDRRTGKLREMGLGPFPDVSLAVSRERASEARVLLAAGNDPLQARRAQKVEQQRLAFSFKQVADEYARSHGRKWKSAKYATWWMRSLELFVPGLMSMPVDAIDTNDVFTAMDKRWGERNSSATQVRRRVEAVLGFAATRGYRSGPNPAIWRGHLANLLPGSTGSIVQHRPAMHYRDVPAFMAKLRALDLISARSLQFLILTAARSQEVLQCRWTEIDLEQKLWTVPAARMKGKREHVVPLSDASMKLLTSLDAVRSSEFVFPGRFPHRPQNVMTMSELLKRQYAFGGVTVHGFRSSFRDWAGDETEVAREIAEAALAHRVGNDVENAYRRSTALARRTKLMESWADYCSNSEERA